MKIRPTTAIILLLASAGCTRYVPPARTPAGASDEWEQAGSRALRHRPTITPTYTDRVRFSRDRPSAAGYRLHMKRGQTVTVSIDQPNAVVLTEIFEEIGPGEPIFRLVHTARPNETRISFEARADGPHIIRLRPDGNRSADARITIAMTAALMFPVLGKTSRAINSGFGDSRDGGRRAHEGVDISAPAGTPVVAVADGAITSVNSTPIGGNVIWQYDAQRNVTYYYAHLKAQIVRRGDRVRAGDVIGTVGNSGNARSTPPHLHFAVYRPGRIAIDPVPFLYNPSMLADDGGTSTKASD